MQLDDEQKEPTKLSSKTLAHPLQELDAESGRYEELKERFVWVDDFANALLKSQEEERRRLCYDIHDGVAQTLVPVLHYLQIIETLPDSRLGEAHALTIKARLQLQKALVQIRAIIDDIKIAELSNMSLTDSLRLELESLQQELGWRVDFDSVDPDLPIEQLEILFRIIKEGLNNIRWHAHTRQVSLKLAYQQDGTFTVLLKDSGVGFNLDDAVGQFRKGRIGLSAMQKRAQDLGATLKIISVKGIGTSLFLTLPVAAKEGSADDNGS
jgi:signal transduction histidine kinase